MSAGTWFGRVAAWAARHARPLLAVTAVVAVAAAVGATQLPTDAGVDTLADPDSATAQATQRVREDFGEEPIVVLAKGELPQLILSDNLFRLLRLEGCLSGKVPKGAESIPGPCTELAETGAVEFLTGPATFLNESVVQIDNQLRRLAENVPADRFREYLLAVATKYGITSAPSITNEDFVATVVFDFVAPARHAEGAPVLPLPQREVGADRDPAEARPERSRTAAGDRPDRSGGAGHDAAEGVQGTGRARAVLRAPGRQLRGLRRAGGDRRRRLVR